MIRTIPSRIMGGGSSKGAYFRRDDLPTHPAVRNDLLAIRSW